MCVWVHAVYKTINFQRWKNFTLQMSFRTPLYISFGAIRTTRHIENTYALHTHHNTHTHHTYPSLVYSADVIYTLIILDSGIAALHVTVCWRIGTLASCVGVPQCSLVAIVILYTCASIYLFAILGSRRRRPFGHAQCKSWGAQMSSHFVAHKIPLQIIAIPAMQ